MAVVWPPASGSITPVELSLNALRMSCDSSSAIVSCESVCGWLATVPPVVGCWLAAAPVVVGGWTELLAVVAVAGPVSECVAVAWPVLVCVVAP